MRQKEHVNMLCVSWSTVSTHSASEPLALPQPSKQTKQFHSHPKTAVFVPPSLRDPPQETHLLLSFLNVRVKKAPGIVTIAGVLIHEKEIGQIMWLSPL